MSKNKCETCNDYMIESKNCLHDFKDGDGCSNWTDKQPISEDKTRYIYDNVLGMIDAFNAPVNLPRYAKAEYTTELETKLEEMTSSCLENLAQKLQYRNIIDDLKNISSDHASYLKVLSEKDQQIEDMKDKVEELNRIHPANIKKMIDWWSGWWKMTESKKEQSK